MIKFEGASNAIELRALGIEICFANRHEA